MTPVTYYLRVRYGECDAQKVVFNSRYGDYVDVAVNEFLRALGYESQLVSGELDFQLVKQTTEWRGPARFDQVLAASVSASRIGTTSFAFGLKISIPLSGKSPVEQPEQKRKKETKSSTTNISQPLEHCLPPSPMTFHHLW